MVTLSSGEWTIDWQIHGHRRRRRRSSLRLIHFPHIHIQTTKFQREPALWLSFSAPILSPLFLLLLLPLLHCLVHHHHQVSPSISLSHLLFLFTFLFVADTFLYIFPKVNESQLSKVNVVFIKCSLVAYSIAYSVGFFFKHVKITLICICIY